MYQDDAILDVALAAAAAGGYGGVHMRVVAGQIGISLGGLYSRFPSKTHLLVAGLAREFQRLDASRDWPAAAAQPQERLAMLTAYLHTEWQRNPRLTEAMVRAFVVADANAASAVSRAANVIQHLFARALGGGDPTDHHCQIAALICDVWLANLTAFVSTRATAAQTRDRIDRAVHRLLAGDSAAMRHERYWQ